MRGALGFLALQATKVERPLGLSKNPSSAGLRLYYIPMQLVAPRAVTIAVAIDAIICTMNLMVSLFVMVY